jgi:hypothetical protein
VIFQQTLKKELGNKVNEIQLTIHISRTSVHVAEVLRSNQEIIRAEHMLLHESNPVQYKLKLNEFFNEKGFNKDYAEVSAAWSTPQHAIIPLGVYNESSKEALFNLLFEQEEENTKLDFNRLMELSLVSIFEIPDWVKSFLVINNPRVMLKHEHAIFLRAIFQANTFKRTVFLSLCDNYLNIAIVYHNELRFSNSFEYLNLDDLIYYFLYVLENQQLIEEKVIVEGYYINQKTKTLLAEFEAQLAQIRSTEKMEIRPFKNSLTLQPLCV